MPDPLDCCQIWSTKRAEQALTRHPTIFIDQDELHAEELWQDCQKPFHRILCSGEKSDLAIDTREGLRVDAQEKFNTIVDPRVVEWSASAGVELAGVHCEAFTRDREAGCDSEHIHQINHQAICK